MTLPTRFLELIGNTPLVSLTKINPNLNNSILIKLEGNNPGGSIKDRAALSMIHHAEQSGCIQKGDLLVEATSGNTGIALAMVAAMKGYRMILVMPENMSKERFALMASYGAKIVVVSAQQGMEGARDLAEKIAQQYNAYQLNQFSNNSNPMAHYTTTGPEIWKQTNKKITHFIGAMGTTGTIMGVSKYLKQKNSTIKIIGLQPKEESKIPGIRRWPTKYLPAIFDANRVDIIEDVSEEDALATTERLAKYEGLGVGMSSGANVFKAMEWSRKLNNAVIVTIACDRSDRYLSEHTDFSTFTTLEQLSESL